MKRYVLSLESPEVPEIHHAVGGKGAILAAMARAGFPVPPGFVILAGALQAFVEANGLGTRIAELTRDSNAFDLHRLGITSSAIGELIRGGTIPSEVVHDIAEAYRGLLDSQSVAVRSSASAEDIPGASGAGEQDTYLNIRGEMRVLDAVRQCWAGFWSRRAMAYRINRCMDVSGFEMAVVVQRMVAADTAGVLFTVNPITGRRDEVVINASWGLGVVVVNGRVTPDTIVVKKAGNRIVNVSIGEKTVMTTLAARGTMDVPVEPHRRSVAALSPQQILELATLGCRIEAHLGEPQDVEWAIADGVVHLLQSRPVTAVPHRSCAKVTESIAPGDDKWPAMGEQPAQAFDVWTHANVGEVWPLPVSPLVWSGVPQIVNVCTRFAFRGLKSRPLAETQWAKRFHGRVYYNEGALAYVCVHELGLPSSFASAALGARCSIDPEWNTRFRPARLLQRLPFLLNSAVRQLRVGRELEKLFPQVTQDVSEFFALDLDRLSDGELWDRLTHCVDRFLDLMKVNTELSISSFAIFALLDRLANAWFKRDGLAHDLITGLSGVHSAEMAANLWAIAQAVLQADLGEVILDHSPASAITRLGKTPQGQKVLKLVDSFLQRHGHHCLNEGEWLNPRWAEVPEEALTVVAQYVRSSGQLSPAAVGKNQQRIREEASSWVRSQKGPIRRAIFLYVLRRTQHLIRLRENGKNSYTKALFPIRRGFAVFGQRWTVRGWLRTPDDVFFLTIPEVESIVRSGDPSAAGFDTHALTRERKKAFDYWFEHDAPEVIRNDGSFLENDGSFLEKEPTPKSGGEVLRGVPVSGGRANGRARIVHHPRQATHFQPGDILVTRATDPGWTPLFPLVAGIVVEIGGQLSHAAIVAREYGIPVVAGVRNATRLLHEGQDLIVDGSTGHVHLGSKPKCCNSTATS